MPVHWLIETDVFPDTAPRITPAVEASGSTWSRYEDGMRARDLPRPGACVLFWGSLGSAYTERVAARWSPGAIGDPDAFRCSRYYPHVGEYLANAEAVFTTAAELVRRPDEILAPLGAPERIFVRPDSALKPFSGRVLATAEPSLEALDHGFYYDDEHLPVVASGVRTIGREWRFVIADGRVIAGCEYSAEREGRGNVVPPAAREQAERIARLPWQPAPLYIADVAECDHALGLLELNPFSGADLYHCDPDAVVAAANRVAERLA